MEDQLDKEYEEWLDIVEPTLPLPIPEEKYMDRALLLRQIYSRLARLEDSREILRLADEDVSDIDKEMDELRIKLKDIMNTVCPVIK